MGWMAAAGAILGLGQGLFNGAQQQSAADEANKLAMKKAKAEFRRAKKEYKIDWWQQKSNWLWETARVEAARYVERQKEADHNWRSQRLIESAMENLAVNESALYDRFVVEENLRAKQVGMEYGYSMNRLAAEAGETVRQYMAGIRDTALQSQQVTNEVERKGQQLLVDLSFDQQKDNLQWEIGQIAALMDSANLEAKTSVRMGNSSSSKLLAQNKAKELGRTWGEMERRSRNREARVNLFNLGVQGETATQLGRMALSMQDQAEKIRYTSSRYEKDSAYETRKLRELQIPSFELAERQYGRELKALQIQTQSVIDEASMPYRKAIIFDPVKPIKGLKPEFFAPTQVYSPSTAGIIGSSILGGVQSAISFGSYTKADGTLGWR